MASVSLSEAEKVYIVHGVQVAAAAARAAAAGGPGPGFARVDRRVWVSLKPAADVHLGLTAGRSPAGVGFGPLSAPSGGESRGERRHRG